MEKEEKEKTKKEVPIPDNVESQDKGTDQQVNIKAREPQKIRKAEERETTDTYEYQEEMRILSILTDPNHKDDEINKNKEDNFLFWYEQMKEETNKDMEQIRKLSKPQTTQGGHPKPKNHIAPYSVKRLMDMAKTKEKDNQAVKYTGKFLKPNEYKNGFMTELTIRGTCPYMPVTLLENKYEALMDSGSGLSLISRPAANKLMNSEIWQKLKTEGKVDYRTDKIVKAVNCDGQPIYITGRIILPTMSIGENDLKTKCSFWVMESATDDVLIANRWLAPLQASLAYRKNKQYLYYYPPNKELKA